MPYDDAPDGDNERAEEANGFCAVCGQPLASPVPEIELASE